MSTTHEASESAWKLSILGSGEVYYVQSEYEVKGLSPPR